MGRRMATCDDRRASRRHRELHSSLIVAALAALMGGGLAATRAGGTPPKPASAGSLLSEGSRAYRLGELDRAIRLWRQIGDLSPDATPHGVRIDALRNLASAYQALGQYRRAATGLSAALSLAERSQDRARLMSLKNALGSILTVMRRWDRAKAFLVESLVLAEQQGNEAARAGILNNLGTWHAAQRDYGKAQKLYAEGAALAQQAGIQGHRARLLANAAICAGAAGRHGEASQHNGEAAELARRLGTRPGSAYILITVGQTDAKLLERLPNSRTRLLKRAFDSYRAALDVARQTRDKRAESYALGYLGRLYELERRVDEGLRLTRRAAFLAQQLRAPELSYRWHWQIGRLAQAKGDLDGASKSLRLAASTFESIRQELASGVGNWSLLTTFREAVGGLYYDLADVQLRLADGVSDPNRVREHVAEARGAIESFKTAEMVDYFRDRCLDLARSDVRKIEDLSADTAVVYLIPLRDRIEVILSHSSGLKRMKVAVGADRLFAEARRYRWQLEDRTSHRYRRTAHQLYRWLIEPLEPSLAAKGITTLVFCPDGALRTVPMAALYDGEQFLVERYAVVVTPGLTLIAPRPFAREWGAVLMCGISEAVGGFSGLPHVRTELGQLEALLGGRCLMNDAFTLQRLASEVAARPPTVLHIASHAQFGSDPSKTFLLTSDSRLTLDELEMLIRPSEFRGRPLELLCLSACETAAGDDRAALGLAGVGLKAGARCSVATLWVVNDETSARLISLFYTNLYDRPALSKAEALREAQRAIMADRRYRHPCYWAPYLIIGNWL